MSQARDSDGDGDGDTLVIFDLDGTLVDTGPDLVASLNHAISTIGLSAFDEADIVHLAGRGARVMIERALELRGADRSEGSVARLLASFLAYYEANMPGLSRPYPGLIAALDRLGAAGMRLAVCTNKYEALARRLLASLAMDGRFAAITGGDTFEVRKPDGGHILGTIDLAGGLPAQTLMVGDSINDIAAAGNAGIPSVAVSFGYSDLPVETLGASRIIDSYDALTVDFVRQLVADRAATR